MFYNFLKHIIPVDQIIKTIESYHYIDPVLTRYEIDHGFLAHYTSYRVGFKNSNNNNDIVSVYDINTPMNIRKQYPFPEGNINDPYYPGVDCNVFGFQATNLATPWSKNVILAEDGETKIDMDVCFEFAKLRKLEYHVVYDIVKNRNNTNNNFRMRNKEIYHYIDQSYKKNNTLTIDEMCIFVLHNSMLYESIVQISDPYKYDIIWTCDEQELSKHLYKLNVSRRVYHKTGTILANTFPQIIHIPQDKPYYYNPPEFINLPEGITPENTPDLLKKYKFKHSLIFKTYPFVSDVSHRDQFLLPIWHSSTVIV